MRFLRFKNLKADGIVNNRPNLKNKIQKQGFPKGRLLGPNDRAWTEDEVQQWLDSRPTDPKPWPGRRQQAEAVRRKHGRQSRAQPQPDKAEQAKRSSAEPGLT